LFRFIRSSKLFFCPYGVVVPRVVFLPWKFGSNVRLLPFWDSYFLFYFFDFNSFSIFLFLFFYFYVSEVSGSELKCLFLFFKFSMFFYCPYGVMVPHVIFLPWFIEIYDRLLPFWDIFYFLFFNFSSFFIFYFLFFYVSEVSGSELKFLFYFIF
jgi:hypothetical protein